MTWRLLRGDSKKEPHNDGRGIVTQRLLRGDSKKRPRNCMCYIIHCFFRYFSFFLHYTFFTEKLLLF
ncbi:MAG: hypothetical protein FWG98_13385 [Candidatus Cloacimonetes bacterium]|nr:hypothetical protein [Candidatus Cloacimonadota bacterium]